MSAEGGSIIYMQRFADADNFYYASDEPPSRETSDIPCSIHIVYPRFTERERKARNGTWYRHKEEALLFPRSPPKLAKWILFTDKEDGEVTLAQLIWGGRCNYPLLCYELWGKAPKQRKDIVDKTDGNLRLRPGVLFGLYLRRSYRRENFDTMPELSSEHFEESEIKSLINYHGKYKDENNRGCFF